MGAPQATGVGDLVTRWLVTGAGGMLGRDLVSQLQSAGIEVVGLARTQLDITDAAAVAAAVRDVAPDVVANCAAWTDVDGAEEHERDALRVNGDGARNVALASVDRGIRMLQMSTDYVFRGDAREPYDEAAPTDPLNAYGRTKLAGETAVLDLLPETGYVVRTAWLYGAHGRNFVATMMRLEQQRETVDVVDDQVGQPTWTVDLGRQMINVVAADAPAGVYHATSSGQVTWHGLATEVFRLLGAQPQRVRPTTSAAVARLAARPAYSVLGHSRWVEAGLPPIRHWREALAEAAPIIRRSTGSW